MYAHPSTSRPSLLDLYLCFQSVALRSFGGVLPWTRRALVEERQWLNEREFSDLLGLCQFLPGPNVGNLTVVVGSRFHGVSGAIAALLGLTLIPVAIVIGLGVLYQQYGQLPAVRGVIDGTAAAAAGLIGGMALKMAKPLLARHSPGRPKVDLAPSGGGPEHGAKPRAQHSLRSLCALCFVALSFVGVGLLRWPLAQVMLVLAPLSILVTWALE